MRKVLFSILILTFLPGCIQNTAMVGPGITLVSTGNFSQAFGTFLTNRAVENETGLQAHELIIKLNLDNVFVLIIGYYES